MVVCLMRLMLVVRRRHGAGWVRLCLFEWRCTLSTTSRLVCGACKRLRLDVLCVYASTFVFTRGDGRLTTATWSDVGLAASRVLSYTHMHTHIWIQALSYTRTYISQDAWRDHLRVKRCACMQRCRLPSLVWGVNHRA